jgi:hypothetical protein
LDCDFSGWVGDGDREEFDAAYFWVGTRGDGEGVFGSIGVVFLVGYLVGSDFGGCSCCQPTFNSFEGIIDEMFWYLDIWCKFQQTEDPFYLPRRHEER